MRLDLGSHFATSSQSSPAIGTLRGVKASLFMVITLLISACSGGFSVEPTDTRQTRLATESRHWDTPWHVTVTLPEAYPSAGDHGYALLLHFAFDQESYEWTRDAVDEHNTRKGYPEIILASLDYVDGCVEVGDEQATGSANTALDHIEEAVLPLLREKYRVDGTVIFTGWSRFGRFATHALTRKPDLFDAAIIRSSAPDDSDLHGRVHDMFAGHPQLALFVYHSIGTEGSEADRRPVFERFKQILKAEAPAGVRWTSEVLEGADHVDTFSQGLRSGLSAYFDEAKRDGAAHKGGDQ